MEAKHMALHNGAFRRLFRARSRKTARPTSSLLDAIAIASRDDRAGSVSQSEEDGVVRIKMVVKRKDLAQVLEAMGRRGSRVVASGTTAAVASVSVEQRLALIRRKHLLRLKLTAASWNPTLQSIPEEIDSS